MLTIELRHLHVADYQVVVVPSREVQSRTAIQQHINVHALVFEHVGDQLGHCRLILHDEHTRAFCSFERGCKRILPARGQRRFGKLLQRFGRRGKFNPEYRATLRRTRNVYLAAMLAHHAQHDCQPQSRPHACGFGSEKRIENARVNCLRDPRAVVLDFQQYPPLTDSFGANPDRSASSLLFEGLLRVAHQIHQHLLQLPGITVHERKRLVQIDLHADLFRGEAEPLELHGPLRDMIQGDEASFRKRFPGIQQQLPQDFAGSLCLLINLPHFCGPLGSVLARQKPLRVAQNGRQRIAQFVRDAADHLAQRGELFSLQQLRLENPLGGQVAINFHSPQPARCRIENGPR